MILAAIAAFFATAPRLYAGASVNVARFVTPAEMRSGSLLLKSEGDRYVEAPLVATDADIVVSGPTARRSHHPDFPQSDRRLGRGYLRIPARRRQRG
jgi:hypothetical protein